jgi:molecular chaperone GrpE
MAAKNNENNMPQENAPQSDESATLREQLDALQKEKDDLFQKLQRLSADYVNYQKRAPRQIADSIVYEKEAIIKSLLPALDNFDQAIANAEKGMTLDAMHKGVQIVYSHLLDILKTHGVEVIDSAGMMFDPSMHQAISQQNDPAKEDGLVVEEFQKGYKLSGRVIRPAKVVVNKWASQPQSEQPDETTDTQ